MVKYIKESKTRVAKFQLNQKHWEVRKKSEISLVSLAM